MRPLYVPVRLTATVMAVAAAAGCMSVGDEGSRAKPSHSAGQQGGEAPEGGQAGGGGHLGDGEGGDDGKNGHGKGKGKHGESVSASASASAGVSPSPPAGEKPGKVHGGKGKYERPGEPTPSKEQPTPPEPPVSSSPEPPASPSPEPTVAEPSSSAHEEPRPQLVLREPAPEAGAPV